MNDCNDTSTLCQLVRTLLLTADTFILHLYCNSPADTYAAGGHAVGRHMLCVFKQDIILTGRRADIGCMVFTLSAEIFDMCL